MKKIISLIMGLLLCIGLCACGTGSETTSNQPQSSKGDDMKKYLGTYIAVGFYDDDYNLLKYQDPPLIILEENNVATVSLNPSSGSGFIFYYEIDTGMLSLTSDLNRDGIPDTEDAVRGSGIFLSDGSINIRWTDGRNELYQKQN